MVRVSRSLGGRVRGVKGGAPPGTTTSDRAEHCGNHQFDRLPCFPIGDDVLDERKRLFLGLGDRVLHAAYEEWGLGSVVEVMTSVVPGGTCIVRILFEDGQQRTFINDMDSELCCCYRGVRKEWRFDFGDVHRVSRGGSRRRLTSR